jgi:5-dehydro-2-deoxygluconokinase
MWARLKLNNFLVIGRAGLDLYADPPGTEIENALQFTAALGGSAANIAVAIAKQGGKSSLLTTVSNDAVGRYTLKALSSYGVDVGHIKTVGGEARNSLAVVETRVENCQSVIYRNNAADFQVQDVEIDEVNFEHFAGLIVTGTALAQQPSRNATLKAVHAARHKGLKVIIDIDYRPYSWSSKHQAQEVCSSAANLCDIIVGNDEEFDVLAGTQNGLALATELAQQTNRIVIYKKGANGCTGFADGKQFETPIFPVTALKPTGAGDGFMGGFIMGLVSGASVPDAVRRGAATAAIVVTRVGCAPAMPSAAEVNQFLLNQQN